jgi:hypothetical protein
MVKWWKITRVKCIEMHGSAQRHWMLLNQPRASACLQRRQLFHFRRCLCVTFLSFSSSCQQLKRFKNCSWSSCLLRSHLSVFLTSHIIALQNYCNGGLPFDAGILDSLFYLVFPSLYWEWLHDVTPLKWRNDQRISNNVKQLLDIGLLGTHAAWRVTYYPMQQTSTFSRDTTSP